ncbi:MAG: efflux RND transporter periplasmic adaptor subunit [Candidatus Ryanbacteria bacterium]|nr:efflux RND transporter periplasmic adaptor subunit [Candidatus Ryanbacteria bacterium]
MIRYLKKVFSKKIVWAGALVVVLLGGYLIFGSGDNNGTQLITVKRGDLVQEVNVTGRVKPASSVDLAFEKGGRAARVSVGVGSRVQAGQILIELNYLDLVAQLREAKANVAFERAQLEELKGGLRPEELAVEEVKVRNSEAAVESARANLIETMKDAYTKADDAVYRRADQFFTNPRTSMAALSFTTDLQMKTDLESMRVRLEPVFSSWRLETSSLTDTSSLESLASEAQQNLNTVKAFLDKASLAVNMLTPTTNLSQTTIDAWKGDISTGRTNVNTALINLAGAGEKHKTALSNLQLAKSEYALKKAGATPEDIRAHEANLERAEASVENIQAQIGKAILRAPIGGVITKQDAKAGEIIPANTVVVSLAGEANFEIESNVPEVDIGKMKLENRAKITLDAFPGENFTGSVVKIDPAETIIDGVVNFKVTIVFDTADPSLKSGLTANLAIETLRKENVLVLPQFAIIENDSGTFVRQDDKDIPVELGVRGSDGYVEIKQGIGEGEQVFNIGRKTSQ